MRTRRLGRAASGQGMVEYALVLVLVAVVAISVIGLTGLAIARNYGVLAGVFGAKREVTGVVTFNVLPQCGYVVGQGTGFYTEISTNIPNKEDLTVSADIGFFGVVESIGGGFKISQQFTPANDKSVCPHSIVIQTSEAYGGTTIVYPVLIQDWPPPS